MTFIRRGRVSAKDIQIVKANTLIEQELQIRWLVEDRLTLGGLSVLAGKPKSGKTVLARYLSYCVAGGHPFLDSMAIERGPVLYISLEDGEDLVKHQLQAMNNGGGPLPIGFVFAKSDPDLAKAIHSVASRMKQPPVLIVVDTLQRLLLVNDLNSYAEVSVAMEPVMDLAAETGAHVMCVHHARKSHEYEGVGDSILGSTALLGSVDCALLVRRYREFRTVETLQRFGPDMDEQVLRLNQSTMKLTLAGDRERYQEGVWARKILRAIADNEGFVYKKELPGVCNIMGKDEAVRLNRVVREMQKAGRLYQGGEGGRKDPLKLGVKPFPEPRVEAPDQTTLDF